MLISFIRVVAVCFGVLVFGSQAKATFHLMQIEQVIGGVNGDRSIQAIQLRMRSSTQRFVSEARLRVWDAQGANPILVIDMDHDVTNGLTGDHVLIVSPNFVGTTTPAAVPNFIMTNLIPASYLAAGSLTFEDDFGTVYWRLSWGGASYVGSTFGDSTNDNDPGTIPADFGPPFPGPLPSTTLQALRFTRAATALSTMNAADYALTTGAAVFTNNARTAFTVVTPPPAPGDIDADGDVDLDDFAACAACLAGPDDEVPPVLCSEDDFAACDLNSDDHVDLADFADLAILQQAR